MKKGKHIDPKSNQKDKPKFVNLSGRMDDIKEEKLTFGAALRKVAKAGKPTK